MPVAGFAYLFAPLFGWLVAGSLKFLINSLRGAGLAWDQIGYGGLPSTHTSIVSTTAALIALREGWASPAFAVALTLGFVVVIDALSLRRQIGRHAAALNRLLAEHPEAVSLRERMGHRRREVLAGVGVGVACGWVLHHLVP